MHFFIEDENGKELITYSSKSVNQFIDCSQPSRLFARGSTVRSVTSVYGYENNDLSKKVELVITGVLNDFESGSDTRLSASIFSNTSELIGFVNGSGSIVGSNSILINGVISGTGGYLDGTNITGKIVGTVSKSNIDGVIDETGVYLLDGSKIKGIFDQSEEFAKNLLVGDPVKIKSIGKIPDKDDYLFTSWTLQYIS